MSVLAAPISGEALCPFEFTLAAYRGRALRAIRIIGRPVPPQFSDQ